MEKMFNSIDGKVYYLLTNKFHLNSITFTSSFPLTVLNSTYINLLEEILKSSIENKIKHYPIKFYIQTIKKDNILILACYFQYPRQEFINPNNILFNTILNIYNDIVNYKNMNTNEIFNNSKQKALKKILLSENDIKTIAVKSCFKALNKDYVSLYGEETIISDISEYDFSKWYRYSISNFYIPKQSFLVGSYNQEFISIIKQNLPDSRELTANSIYKEGKIVIDKPVIVEKEVKSKIGFLVIALQVPSPEKYNNFNLKLLSEYLGGGGYSLLFNKIREELKLVYQISTTCDQNKGEIIISAKVAKNNLKEVTREIDKEILLLQRQQINESIFWATFNAVRLDEARILDRPLSLTRSYINTLTNAEKNNENMFNYDEFNKLIRNVRKVAIVSVLEG
ncbi:insulinase family protein [Oceanobacillus oncorhynchi]|uniref:insulinase family protein n=1 Tax=Oceanobacillus oncorhynchi TaxID=545501 RepID=UPI00186630B3|nr:insulinase family protein [Oceanobacillus oncorhynchi]